MNVDWQAYDAGLMSKEDLAAVEALLARDPEARAELEGLRRFKTALASVREAEHAPVGALRERCFKKRNPRRLVLLFGGLAAAAAAITWTWSTFLNEPLPDYGPVICSIQVTDPSEASTYLRTHSRLNLGVLDPSPMAKIKSVTAGPQSAQYKIEFRGSIVVFNALPPGRTPYVASPVERNGRHYTLAEIKDKTQICWSTESFNFNLTGPSREDLWPLAEDLAAKTSAWR